MGCKVIQQIRECYVCGRIPEDGEVMWSMPDGFICEDCADTDESTEE